MKIIKDDIKSAIKQANFARSFLGQANEPGLAGEAGKLVELLQAGNISEANQVLTRLQAEVGKLLKIEKKDIKEHKPHRHIVKEIKCASCGGLVPEDSNFCPHCGYTQKRKDCPSCGADNDGDAKFCGKCGTKF